MDRAATADELAAARTALHALLNPAELRHHSHGTRWTDHQVLLHCVLGYAVVRVLLPLVRLLGRPPAPRAAASRPRVTDVLSGSLLSR